jgi:hypothetical protein
MKASVLVVAVFALGACASVEEYVLGPKPVTEYVTPDGQRGLLVRCNQDGIPVCHQRARETCGGDYTLTNQTERQVYSPADRIARMEASTSTVRSIEVTCAAPTSPVS